MRSRIRLRRISLYSDAVFAVVMFRKTVSAASRGAELVVEQNVSVLDGLVCVVVAVVGVVQQSKTSLKKLINTYTGITKIVSKCRSVV